MAKATATCTCHVCGQTFIKEKQCYNRKEADEWALWAEAHYNLCPNCWKDQQNQDVIKNGAHYKVCLYLEGIYDLKVNKDLAFVFDNKSYSVKDKLKEIGAEYIDNRWVILCDFERCEQLTEKLSHMPAIKDSEPSKKDIEFFKYLRNKKEDAYRVIKAEKKAYLTEIENCLSRLGDASVKLSKDKYWNGKFYGKPGSWKIYIDNRPIEISNQEKDDLTRFCVLKKQMLDDENQKNTSINDEIRRYMKEYRTCNIMNNWF